MARGGVGLPKPLSWNNGGSEPVQGLPLKPLLAIRGGEALACLLVGSSAAAVSLLLLLLPRPHRCQCRTSRREVRSDLRGVFLPLFLQDEGIGCGGEANRKGEAPRGPRCPVQEGKGCAAGPEQGKSPPPHPPQTPSLDGIFHMLSSSAWTLKGRSLVQLQEEHECPMATVGLPGPLR